MSDGGLLLSDVQISTLTPPVLKNDELKWETGAKKKKKMEAAESGWLVSEEKIEKCILSSAIGNALWGYHGCIYTGGGCTYQTGNHL